MFSYRQIKSAELRYQRISGFIKGVFYRNSRMFLRRGFMKKTIQTVVGTAVSALLILVSPSAFAAPRSLPSGQGLYAFGCDLGTEPSAGLVDVATGVVTEVVPGNIDGQCYQSPAYNSVDGKVYIIDWDNGFELRAFDLQAKTSTLIGAFVSTVCQPFTLAIDALGNAWTWDDRTNNLRPVNLTDATCGTGVGVVDGGADFYGMSFAPNGTLYGVSYASGQFGTISTTDGSFAQVGTSAMTPFRNQGLTFDSSGTAWVVDNTNLASVYSADISNYSGTAELAGQLTFEGEAVYFQAIVVAPLSQPEDPDTPTLAETGSTPMAPGMSGLAAAGLLALGVLMKIVRRRAS